MVCGEIWVQDCPTARSNFPISIISSFNDVREKKRSVFTSLFVIQHGTIIYVFRNCIGQAFALAEIKTAIAMILRK